MFVNVSPAHWNVGETISSLSFAQRCRETELNQAKKILREEKSPKKSSPRKPSNT